MITMTFTLSTMTKIRPHIGPVLILLAATMAVYLRILGHDFQLNWDDNSYVVDNAAVHGFSWAHVRTVFSTYYVGNYAPVQMISYMLDYVMWGLWAGGFLLTNIVIHSVNGILVYRLFVELLGERFVATVGAAMFLLHPVQVETVAWVSQRKNLLAMMFFLLSWLWYIYYREVKGRKQQVAYTVSLAAFALALLSKSIVVIFPLVLVIYDFCYLPSTCRKRLLDKVPYALAAGIAAYLALQSQSLYEGGGRELDYHGGTLLATFYTMLPVFCKYVSMLVWPVHLSAGYAPQIHTFPDLSVCLSGLFLCVLLFIGIKLFIANRKLGFWVIFIVLGLLPVSQIVPLSTLINDRYLYFPIIGVAALFAVGTAKLRDMAVMRFRLLCYSMLALCYVVLSTISFRQVGVWRNAVSLWSNAVVINPESPHIWERLGEAYHSATPIMAERALNAYNRALELTPSSDVSLKEMTLYNVGLLCNKSGEFETGHNALIRLLESNPDHVMGWVALGDNLKSTDNFIEAEASYLRAYDLQPEAVRVLLSLGGLYVKKGAFDKGREYYRQAESAVRNDAEVAYHLACLEAQAGNGREALVWLEKALQRGWKEFEVLMTDNDLFQLRKSPEFDMLVRRYIPARNGN